MSYGKPIYTPGLTILQTFGNVNGVIFPTAATNSSLFNKYISLFPGISFAAGYKILQRMYKFGGQPFVKGIACTLLNKFRKPKSLIYFLFPFR